MDKPSISGIRANLGTPIVAWKGALLRRMQAGHWTWPLEAVALIHFAFAMLLFAILWDLTASVASSRLRKEGGEP